MTLCAGCAGKRKNIFNKLFKSKTEVVGKNVVESEAPITELNTLSPEEHKKVLANRVKERNSNIWMGIVALGALGIIISIPIFIWVSPKLGITLGVGSLVASSISYFLALNTWVMIGIGGIILLCALSILFHKLILVHRAMRTHDDPNVDTMEVLKGVIKAPKVSNQSDKYN
jgi:hypothetical protein